MMNKKAQIGDIVMALVGLFFLILIIALIGAMVIAVLNPNILLWQTTFNGHHTGVVTAVETNGMFFPTDRVYFKTDSQSSQEDAYCVIDDNIKSQLEQYSKVKQTVTITFEDYAIVGYGLCGSEIAIITGVSK